MKHFLSVGKLQSDNEYKKDFAKSRSQFHSGPDQPGFLQAKRSQQLASDVSYRQPLPQPTCDPEQLGLKHARKAHQLQSDVKYKSDLNLTRGIGWTPPGSYKVEMARRAAELANARGLRGAYVSSGCKPTPAGKALGEGKLIVSFQTLFLAKGQLALKMCERQLRQGA